MTRKHMAISRKSSATATTYTLPKLFIFLFLFHTFSWNSVSFSAAAADPVSYADHCASVVPESTPRGYAGAGHFVNYQTGYYTGGGSGILSPNSSYRIQNSIEFSSWNVRETDVEGLFELRAYLRFEKARTYYFVGDSTNIRSQQSGGSSSSHQRRSVQFLLGGFWSASSGKLCMVGSGFGNYLNGRNSLKNLYAVLKLYNLMNSSSVTSLISGTLESLSKNHPNSFELVSIVMPPSMNYQYTLVTDTSESDSSFSGTESVEPPNSVQIQTFCSVLSRKVLDYEFDLKYSSLCVSAKNCTPFAAATVLPRVVSLKPIECFEDTRTLRVLVELSDRRKVWYRRPFDPTTTLVGEGSWDAKKNQLFVAACQFLDAAGSWNNIRVGDCSARLSLRFPAIWTIGNTSGVAGRIWSNKTVTDSGYFRRIVFESPQNARRIILLPGQKYEYTQLDKVTKLCTRKTKGASADHKSNRYPNPFSYDMRFDFSANNSKGEVSWASCGPLSVGDRFYHQNLYSTGNANSFLAPASYSYSHNISYQLTIRMQSSVRFGNTSSYNVVQISAEGIYDETEGSLCMVGCIILNPKNLQLTSDSVDCEVLVTFQFPPANSSGFIKGRIESTRKKFDPLHFEHLDLTSAAGYVAIAKRSIWRMDVEIILVLVSTTLACVFEGLQLFHVKKHPSVLPSISVFMLLVQSVGYMVPLMLNFDAMFTNSSNRQNVSLGSGGWLEVNEVIVRVITMVAFLLQIRLLQLTWSARSADGTEKELWTMEKKALFVALPLYAAGALAALLLLSWRKVDINHDRILGVLKSYAGLVLDGFLLPQILLNMFCKSKEQALSVSFYIGTTFIRVLPHAYDLYRAHNSAHHQLNGSYIYANPVADFYSTAWDVIIPFGALMFAGIIYLQQKFGGLCLLPQKLRNLKAYEKVPTVSEGSLSK